MNIQEAKAEICNTLRAYLAKDENGYYTYPLIRQRPLLLIGPPGIGKTAIMEQAAAECGVGLAATPSPIIPVRVPSVFRRSLNEITVEKE